MTGDVRGYKYLNVYNCISAFQRSDEEGMQKIQTLKSDVQNKIFKCLWEVRGCPTRENNSAFAHDDFGRVSMLNQEPRCWSTNEQKAEAVKKHLNEKVSERFEAEMKDAKTQQAKQTDSLHFSFANASKMVCYNKRIDPPEKSTLKVAERSIGIAHMQGRRDEMEDEYLATEISFLLGEDLVQAEVYGVFDGHDGVSAAKYLKKHFADEFQKSMQKFNCDGLSDIGIYAAIKEVFVNLDKSYTGQAGSAATVILIVGDTLYAINLGDSRAVLSNGGAPIQLSEDQKCDNEKYTKGVIKRGGSIIHAWDSDCPRVNDMLAMPRAFGDHGIKGVKGENCIVHSPIITKFDLSDIKPNSACILACDGLWDECSTAQAVALVSDYKDESLEILAERLIVKAFNAGSEDNISAIVVKLN